MVGDFHDQDWVRGERIALAVGDLPLNDSDCLVHGFRDGAKVRGAFRSDCGTWEDADTGLDVLIFFVALRNDTRRAVNYSIRDFVMTARDRRTFGPVNVRSEAETPPNFLQETGTIPPVRS